MAPILEGSKVRQQCDELAPRLCRVARYAPYTQLKDLGFVCGASVHVGVHGNKRMLRSYVCEIMPAAAAATAVSWEALIGNRFEGPVHAFDWAGFKKGGDLPDLVDLVVSKIGNRLDSASASDTAFEVKVSAASSLVVKVAICVLGCVRAFEVLSDVWTPRQGHLHGSERNSQKTIRALATAGITCVEDVALFLGLIWVIAGREDGDIYEKCREWDEKVASAIHRCCTH
jgi:hypothetical protein